jgi:hypothetical protein
MALFSTALLTVLEGLPSGFPQDLTTTYRQLILNNAENLESVWHACGEGNPNDKVSAAIKACSILFGERAVIPRMSSYEKEEQKNWYVLPFECCSDSNMQN